MEIPISGFFRVFEFFKFCFFFSKNHRQYVIFHPKTECLNILFKAFPPFFQVLCRMIALPYPTSFRWTFNNSYEANDVPTSKYKSNGTLSRLNYRAESEKDFGLVHCWAANVLGESNKPCVFTLIPAGKNKTKLIWIYDREKRRDSAIKDYRMPYKTIKGRKRPCKAKTTIQYHNVSQTNFFLLPCTPCTIFVEFGTYLERQKQQQQGFFKDL